MGFRSSRLVPALFALTSCIVVTDDRGPLAGMYEGCSFTEDCTARADACYIITVAPPWGQITDGMCSVSCRSDWDCPYDGACYSVMGNPYICYERCLDDFDCAHGFGCTATVGGLPFDSICLPAW